MAYDKNMLIKKRNALAAARTQKAAKLRGEMGYNPSGTQGARGTEAAYMNPAVYQNIMPLNKRRVMR